MKFIKITFAAFLICLVCLPATAQTAFRQWEFNVFAGYNLGGTTPLPLPSEIRKIKSWRPGFTPTLAFHATRWINSEWGITSGIAIDLKGMAIKANVKYMYTSLLVGEGDQQGTFEGSFSGENKTTVKNGYITVPVLATYRPFERWTFHGGGYISFLQDKKFEGNASDGYIRVGGSTGDRINIDQATFDFSDEQRKIDAGLMLGADWRFTSRMSLKGQLSWSVVPIFPSGFKGIPYKMYNVYFMLGIGYRI